MHGYASEDTFAERCDHLVVVFDFLAYEAAECAAVLFVYDDVVSHVDKTACEVTGVGGFQCRVGKTLTRTVGRDEVFEHRQTFLEVCQNRVFDDLASFGTGLLGFRHKTTHACKLTDLVFRTTGTRVEHHEH